MAISGGQKSNLSGRFKLKLITTNHLRFVIKILWKCCGCITSNLLKILYFENVLNLIF